MDITDLVPRRTRGCEHLFTGEYSIGTSHETQSLFRFGQCVSSSRKPDDGRREHDASCCNSANENGVRNTLDAMSFLNIGMFDMGADLISF